MPGTILEKIVETKRREVAAAIAAQPLLSQQRAAEAAEAPRDFYAAIAGTEDISLIAEIKKKSPSAGVIREAFDPVQIARTYEDAGAKALSVLTDKQYFAGDLSFIRAVKKETSLPVLRKDFIVDAYQVYESRSVGADAILLIAEILTAAELESLSSIAFELGMATLIELHSASHFPAVLPLVSLDRRTILGINHRDLHAQRTDLRAGIALAHTLPPGTRFVAESGIKTRHDVDQLRQCGACGILVGETLLRAEDIGAKVRELIGA